MLERHIHLVDDDDVFRDSVRVLLEISGFKVFDYTGGRDFLDRLEPHPQGCALVDVNMPDMDGLSLLRECSARGLRLPIVVITGAADIPLAVRAMKAGAVDFIEKPLRQETLLTVLAGIAAAVPEDAGLSDFAARLASLTEREREVLAGIVAGHPTKVIAYRLGISPRTVDVHRLHIGEKLAVSGLSNLVRLALAVKFPIGPRWSASSEGT